MVRQGINFFRYSARHRRVLFSLAKQDIRARFAGSLLGPVWFLIHPAILILVFWMVFSLGFRVKPLADVPFVAWLTTSLAAWFLFSDLVSTMTPVITANAPIIKKTVFPSQILPLVKAISAVFGHLVFVILLLVLIGITRVPFSFFFFQAIYYAVCAMVLGIGLGWAVSALSVFIRDVEQVVGVVLQVGFWATPVFWDLTILPEPVQQVVSYNPVFYIVQGYRDSFLYHVPFWAHPVQTLWFWCVALVALAVGATVFQRLKPQFADVL
ncbi:MAG: teichoic acid ABC transporter permease [Deltaproteobacteria bacterium]|nr:MAG: teichoic acid ABC transporter permease [Deltaproteobacteria bacterium]